MGHTRRRLLQGASLGVVALAGCSEKPPPEKAPDPLQPLLDEALALAAAYDRAIAAQPDRSAQLTPLAADHRAHAAELSRLIGTTTSAPASTAPLTDLKVAEQAAQKTAVAVCKAATAELAGFVGSIAACRATHVEALR